MDDEVEKYLKCEKETHISTDDECGTWKIYTHQNKIKTKLRKLGIEPYKVDSDGASHYENIPFNQISFRAASTRTMSVENKIKAGERLSKAREAKNK